MRCSVCGADARRPFLDRNGFPIVSCACCGFLFVSPPPTSAEIYEFYQRGEYYEGNTIGYGDYLGDRRRHEQLARGRLRRIERLLPGRGRVLDVGCAAGFFLGVAQERGWEPLGIELSLEMAARAARLIGRPVAATLEELALPPGSLDAVTMWEYIEHVPEPRAEIERFAALLRPGGLLALSTPNAGYWTAVHEPERWREFSPPAHLGFFTEATLRRLLSACGLRVVAMRRTLPRAPRQSYSLYRLLALLRERVGSGAQRRSPLWWSFSLAWRLAERLSQALHLLRWPGSDLHIGLEAYARKQ